MESWFIHPDFVDANAVIAHVTRPRYAWNKPAEVGRHPPRIRNECLRAVCLAYQFDGVRGWLWTVWAEQKRASITEDWNEFGRFPRLFLIALKDGGRWGVRDVYLRSAAVPEWRYLAPAALQALLDESSATD